LAPELKYLNEFDISEISRTLNLEKVVVYGLGIIFYRVYLMIGEKEYLEQVEKGQKPDLQKIKNEDIKKLLTGMLKKK
jgi:hypothetical protein